MKGSTLLGVILVATSLLFFGWSFSYRGMAGFVPLVLSMPTVALAVLCLAGERYPGILKVFEVSLEDVLTSAAEVKVEIPGAQARPKAGDMGLITRMFGWFALFGLLVFITGFYISTTVFALSFTRIQGGINWFGAVFITALALGFFYFIFQETLSVDLFEGVLFGAFIPPL